MRVFVCVCIFAVTLLAGNPQSFWQNRFGIVPLRSTRADVERLYGVCGDSLRCIFRTPKEQINVAYATAPCAGLVRGWNVPTDTVLSFTVRPYVPLRFSEIASDLNGFVERYNGHEPMPYYTNIEKGIVFSVQDGRVFSVTYFPPSNEHGKRCEGFPRWEGVPPPRPYAVISNLNYVYASLDNFAIELSGNTQLRGYIIIYAGRKSRRGEAKEMAEGARKYLIDKRMVSPDRFIAIDGGFRENAEYDLFTVGLEIPPPTPTPTVPSNEVHIVKTPRTKPRSPKRR